MSKLRILYFLQTIYQGPSFKKMHRDLVIFAPPLVCSVLFRVFSCASDDYSRHCSIFFLKQILWYRYEVSHVRVMKRNSLPYFLSTFKMKSENFLSWQGASRLEDCSILCSLFFVVFPNNDCILKSHFNLSGWVAVALCILTKLKPPSIERWRRWY